MMASLETLHAASENGVLGQKIGYPKSKQRVVLLSDYTVSQSTLGVRTNLSTTPSRRSKLETKRNTSCEIHIEKHEFSALRSPVFVKDKVETLF